MKTRDPDKIDAKTKIRMDVSTTLRIQTQQSRVMPRRGNPIKPSVGLKVP